MQVTGTGYAPEGEFLNQDHAITLGAAPDLAMLLLDGLLCNDAVLQKESGHWVILGDPTEGALVVMACKASWIAINSPNLASGGRNSLFL
jgi:Ca2+-transporting ATPase